MPIAAAPRDDRPDRAGGIGQVVSARGSHVSLRIAARAAGSGGRATVGCFVGIRSAGAYLIGVITELASVGLETGPDTSAEARLDLMGEIVRDDAGGFRFRRGVGSYPAIGDAAEPVSGDVLRLIYRPASDDAAVIGTLHQDPTIPAVVNVDDLLSRHFAVLGATGVGKSSGVAVLLGEILRARPDLRVFLLDGHNEYGQCFGAAANIVGARTLKLPFWLFNFEEFVDVVYGGRPPVAEETDVLAELIPLAKASYGQHKSSGDRLALKRADPKSSGVTVDTPVPYLLQDLLNLLDERMGRLENRASRMVYHRLITRIETIRNDPRYGFMFENAHVGGDMMGELVAHLFRLGKTDKPMTVMQLGGLPAEVVDAVVCVLSRLAFEFGLWSEGAVPLLFVCEEAHRYASADPSIGFNPTRRALSRIAKEGRKYGVFLGLVTQRPAELDPTIISQCATLFAMRMANERDQALLRSAVSDAAANLLDFVPSLGTREVIGFGEGVPLPARMTFKAIPAERLPRTDGARRLGPPTDPDFVTNVVERWRGATMATKPQADGPPERETLADTLRSRQSATADGIRHQLLRKALDGGTDGAATPAGASSAGGADSGLRLQR